MIQMQDSLQTSSIYHGHGDCQDPRVNSCMSAVDGQTEIIAADAGRVETRSSSGRTKSKQSVSTCMEGPFGELDDYVMRSDSDKVLANPESPQLSEVPKLRTRPFLKLPHVRSCFRRKWRSAGLARLCCCPASHSRIPEIHKPDPRQLQALVRLNRRKDRHQSFC